jgi:peptide chain release factor 1
MTWEEKAKTLEEKLDQLHEELIALGNPSAERYQTAARELKMIEPAVAQYRQWRKVQSDIISLKSDPDPAWQKASADEVRTLSERAALLERQIQDFLTPKDPDANRSAIIEIRAGAGGDEAALFAGELSRMYLRFAQSKNLDVKELDSHPTGLGGYKEIILMVSGPCAFKLFRHEQGVHRVQRVPETEASGRVHTSTVTVAVLPEAGEVDIDVNPADLKIDTYRSSGAGGQHVNKTESAIRITHLPTGLIVACQDERSQMQNRAKAMMLLRTRLKAAAVEKLSNERKAMRKEQVGTGERSEKIRTYNFPQDRVTDHRINQNFHDLPSIFEGHMDGIVEALLNRETE